MATNSAVPNLVPPAPVPQKMAVQPTIGTAITSFATGITYTVGRKIGEGAFGIVYACKDVWNNDLAMKVLKPIGSYEKVKGSATSEFNKLRTLRHPNITFVFDAFEFRDTFYIVTERCSLSIKDMYTLVTNFCGPVWIKPIARCLLQAVHYLHINNYVHQDIHSGNVLYTLVKDEVVPDSPQVAKFKLGDLGVARVLHEIDVKNTRAQWMLPPEVLNPAEFGPMDRRMDIYHVGLLFLQLMHSKELVFSTEEVLAGKPREMACSLPAPYNTALEKALRRHVQHRTADAMELWHDIDSPVPAAS
jgi:serine/threonine-protein kinase